jgi:hypothetical protein
MKEGHTLFSFNSWVVTQHRFCLVHDQRFGITFVPSSGFHQTLMMGQTCDPETLVVNQAKTTLGNNPKAKTKYCNPSGSLKSHKDIPCHLGALINRVKKETFQKKTSSTT